MQQPQQLNAEQLANGIQYMLAIGLTGDKAAEYIRDQVPDGKGVLEVASDDTAESLFAKIKADPNAAKLLLKKPEDETRIKIFLSYFVLRSKEICGRTITKQ